MDFRLRSGGGHWATNQRFGQLGQPGQLVRSWTTAPEVQLFRFPDAKAKLSPLGAALLSTLGRASQPHCLIAAFFLFRATLVALLLSTSKSQSFSNKLKERHGCQAHSRKSMTSRWYPIPVTGSERVTEGTANPVTCWRVQGQ